MEAVYYRMTVANTEEENQPLVTTPDECVAYVNRVGICSWRQIDYPPNFASLEQETPWDSNEIMLRTWFWKDDLPIERKLYYGKLLGAETPAFVSMDMLPFFIAAQGDNDPHTLFERGRLSQMAFDLYSHIERAGPTPSNQLPWRSGSRQMHLITLERRFLITKHDLTGRTRGKYGYIWGKCEDHFPDAFTAASRIRVADARQHIIDHLAAQSVVLTMPAAMKFFRWLEE